MVVQVHHPYRQPAYHNHCKRYNGHCTHICLPAPQVSSHSPRTSCACPQEMVLQADGRSCQNKGCNIQLICKLETDIVSLEIPITNESDKKEKKDIMPTIHKSPIEEKRVEEVTEGTQLEVKEDSLDDIDAEAVAIVSSSSSHLAGVIVGCVLAAVLVTSVVWLEISLTLPLINTCSVGYICAAP